MNWRKAKRSQDVAANLSAQDNQFISAAAIDRNVRI